jgi:hypothetical protein
MPKCPAGVVQAITAIALLTNATNTTAVVATTATTTANATSTTSTTTVMLLHTKETGKHKRERKNNTRLYGASTAAAAFRFVGAGTAAAAAARACTKWSEMQMVRLCQGETLGTHSKPDYGVQCGGNGEVACTHLGLSHSLCH